MHQFKRNGGLIFKTFLYQVVMSLFGFMMYSSTYKIPLIMTVGQITITIFYLYIMFHQMYQQGAKNCEYDWAHSLSSSPAFGFLFCLIAFLPTILLSAYTCIFPPYASEAMQSSYPAFLINKVFLQGMHVGFFQWLFPTSSAASVDAAATAANAVSMNAQCFAHLFGCIPGIIACGLGYFFGYEGFKKDKKKK